MFNSKKDVIMLSNISWGSYLTAVVILTTLWYSIVIYKYYRKDLQNIFKGKWKSSGKIRDNKLNARSGLFLGYSESFSTLEDAEELYHRLLSVFAESSTEGFSNVAFKNYTRFVLSEYPFVKQSALRGEINTLMVLESEKYPEFILTHAEMDGLWEEEQQ